MASERNDPVIASSSQQDAGFLPLLLRVPSGPAELRLSPPRRAHPPPSRVVLDENHIRKRAAAPERRVYELRGGVSGFPLGSGGFLKFAAQRENTEVKARFITLAYFPQSRAPQTSVWLVWRRPRAKAGCFNRPAGRPSSLEDADVCSPSSSPSQTRARRLPSAYAMIFLGGRGLAAGKPIRI